MYSFSRENKNANLTFAVNVILNLSNNDDDGDDNNLLRECPNMHVAQQEPKSMKKCYYFLD